QGNPLWIALDGIDGCGKSTQVKRVVDSLKDATPFRFPSDPVVIAEALETSHPLERALIFMADMVNSATMIRAIKKDGGCAVSDRSIVSTYAYQSVKCIHGDFKAVDMYRQLNIPSLIPDLVVYIRIPLAEALRRIQSRAEDGVDISEFEVPERLARTYRQMELLIPELTKSNIAVTVDGLQPMEKVTLDILAAIRERQ
ncbi:MAG: thymidylate kinase, partial [Spirochaetia bacterium]|nr:thymidylate kinase [Spirochaetia bacterium]